MSESWTTVRASRLINELLFFERASANVISGWVPKVAEMDLKLALGTYFHQGMERSSQLMTRLVGLTRFREGDLKMPSGWKQLMVRVDKAGDTLAMVESLFLVVKRRVLDLYTELAESADPVCDPFSRRIAERMILELEDEIDWAKVAVKPLRKKYRDGGTAQRIEASWEKRESGKLHGTDDALWPPVDRVPEVARPSQMSRGKAGALRLVPSDALRNSRDIGLFLHNNIGEEYTTMELICRNSYEHPNMPWQFHRDMARQAADEARHAKMLHRLASEFAVDYGGYPVYTYSYDGVYEFTPCDPGGRRELLWRILLRQTFQEGLALDSLAFELEKREYLKQREFVRIWEFLLSDEVFHVQSGLKWSRYLCDDDTDRVLRERAEAHDFFVERVKRRRARYVAENPAEIMAELQMLEDAEKHNNIPFQMTVNRHARLAAGFTDKEIQQVLDWGYVDAA